MKINYSSHFQSLADQYAENEALVNVERNRRYTYRAMHLLTNQIVNMMREELSLKSGDHFINILDNDNMGLLHLPTILKGDATAAFTNFRDSLDEHTWQVDCAKPKVAFIENSLIESHYTMLRERDVAIVCMDPIEEPKEGLYCFWSLVNAASKANPNIEIDDRDHNVLIRFTGGTTGKGKPAMYSADNWMAIRDSFYALPDKVWKSHTRMLHIAPVSHGSGLLWLPAFYAGACNITLNEPDLVRYCQTIEKERVTSAMLVPTILYRLLELKEARDSDFSTLQNMFYGAAPMSPAKLSLLQEKFGNIFIQVYASTEHPAIALSLSKQAHRIEKPEDEGRLAAAGQVAAGIELVINDSEGKQVEGQEIGEIWIRSRATIQGYYQNPEQTAEEFINGYWKSGDMGYKDTEGFIYLVDRKKDMIISGGFNVYATEVEAIVNSHKAVLMSAVVGIPHEEWGEAVHAEVMLREGQELGEKELIQFVKDKIGSYKAPKTVLVVDELPMSVVGKVLRRSVREKYWKAAGRKVG
ncbi:MAG: AMP-binding protein [Pseudomonadales bacterium]|nr:AMP-binding protein [Pseudomonadales bacterium]